GVNKTSSILADSASSPGKSLLRRRVISESQSRNARVIAITATNMSSPTTSRESASRFIGVAPEPRPKYNAIGGIARKLREKRGKQLHDVVQRSRWPRERGRGYADRASSRSPRRARRGSTSAQKYGSSSR